MRLENVSNRQADFVVLHFAERRRPGASEIFEVFREIFLAENCCIERIGGKSGKIVKYSDATAKRLIADASDSSIEMFGGENTFKYSDLPSSWKLMLTFFPKRNLIVVGKAAPALGGSLDEKWVFYIIAKVELMVAVNYGYAYSTSIPYGVGYAIGFYREDEYHDIVDFDESDRISRWKNAVESQRCGPYLREIFQLNVFDDEKISATNIKSAVDSSWEFKSIGRLRILQIPENDMFSSRSRLMELNMLISEHPDGRYSQE